MKKQITLKHDLSVNWAKAINFIPKIDELILYDGVMENGNYVELPRLKRGDGVTKLKDLPFLDSENSQKDLDVSYSYYDETLELFNKEINYGKDQEN
jgi:hypothetical protein